MARRRVSGQAREAGRVLSSLTGYSATRLQRPRPVYSPFQQPIPLPFCHIWSRLDVGASGYGPQEGRGAHPIPRSTLTKAKAASSLTQILLDPIPADAVGNRSRSTTSANDGLKVTTRRCPFSLYHDFGNAFRRLISVGSEDRCGSNADLAGGSASGAKQPSKLSKRWLLDVSIRHVRGTSTISNSEPRQRARFSSIVMAPDSRSSYQWSKPRWRARWTAVCRPSRPADGEARCPGRTGLPRWRRC